MHENRRAFWHLSSRSLFVLVAIYGPLMAAYGVVLRVVLGYDEADDRSLAVATSSIVVAGTISVIYAFVLLHARRKTDQQGNRSQAFENACDD